MRIFAVLIVVLFSTLVSAQSGGYDSSGFNFGLSYADSLLRYALGLFFLIPTMLVGGIASLAFLFFLQYVGIDVVGWSIAVFRFFFDNLFLLIRWTLSTPENLISAVILFIIFWAVLLFGGPAI